MAHPLLLPAASSVLRPGQPAVPRGTAGRCLLSFVREPGLGRYAGPISASAPPSPAAAGAAAHADPRPPAPPAGAPGASAKWGGANGSWAGASAKETIRVGCYRMERRAAGWVAGVPP